MGGRGRLEGDVKSEGHGNLIKNCRKREQGNTRFEYQKNLLIIIIITACVTV